MNYSLGETIVRIWESSGFTALTWRELVMILISCVLFYLAIVKKFEPLLLLPISFGMLLANLPLTGLLAGPSERTGRRIVILSLSGVLNLEYILHLYSLVWAL